MVGLYLQIAVSIKAASYILKTDDILVAMGSKLFFLLLMQEALPKEVILPGNEMQITNSAIVWSHWFIHKSHEFQGHRQGHHVGRRTSGTEMAHGQLICWHLLANAFPPRCILHIWVSPTSHAQLTWWQRGSSHRVVGIVSPARIISALNRIPSSRT